jgi:hypothetical protein
MCLPGSCNSIFKDEHPSSALIAPTLRPERALHFTARGSLRRPLDLTLPVLSPGRKPVGDLPLVPLPATPGPRERPRLQCEPGTPSFDEKACAHQPVPAVARCDLASRHSHRRRMDEPPDALAHEAERQPQPAADLCEHDDAHRLLQSTQRLEHTRESIVTRPPCRFSRRGRAPYDAAGAAPGHPVWRR